MRLLLFLLVWFSLPNWTLFAQKALTVTRDIDYRNGTTENSPQTRLDIYSPTGGKQMPVMVFVHGGAWRIGDKKTARLKPAFFAKQGYVFVTINYRLIPNVAFPTNAEDVGHAVAWIHGNIDKFGGNPKRIFLMGHSAGAHLAALISIDSKYLNQAGASLDVLKGTILLDGAAYDIPWQMKNAGPASKKLYIAAFGTDDKTYREASPITHVAAGRDIPPFLIIPIGSRTISQPQSRRLAAELEKCNIPASVFIADGKTHRTLNIELGKDEDAATHAVMEFMEVYRK